MEIVDSGVLQPSFMDFTIPSAFARQALYYVSQIGHFYCNQDYAIARQSLPEDFFFLFVYVCSGALQLRVRGKPYTAQRGQIALIDCRTPHEYFSTGQTEFLWFHFSGCGSAAYCDYLYSKYGAVFDEGNDATLRQSFDNILAYAQAVPSNEHMISYQVTRIFSRLAAPGTQNTALSSLEPAIQYIREHYPESLPLDVLAAQCSMSPSHFIRMFQRSLGQTPHEYLLAYRLRQAKRLLAITNATIEEIAARSGFNSASHFARAFRASNGISPTMFRTMSLV